MSWVWLDGTEFSWPTEDPATRWGEGVFTTVRVQNGICLWLKEHLERLQRASKAQTLPPLSITETQIRKFAASSRELARLKIARTTHHQWMHLQPYRAPQDPIRVGVFPFLTESHQGFKTLRYDHRKRVRVWALEHGYQDALTVTPEGY